LLILILYVADFSSSQARANDSTAVIASGGLVLQKSIELSLRSEKLRVGPSRIAVDYEIENTTSKDVEAILAFPLPVLEGPMLANTPVDIPRGTGDNFVRFRTTVDGVEIKPEQQVKAYRIEVDGSIGKDVTDIVRSAGILASPLNEDYYDRVADLPEGEKNRLVENKLLEAEHYSDRTNYTPLWGIEFTYFSKHRFPPGKILRVHHEYTPVTGRSLFGAFSSSDDLSRWCVDETTKKGVSKLVASRPLAGGWEKVVDRKEVDYVLKTGANWAGPIGSFELIIDKENPQSITSLCFEGLEKISNTEFRATRRNFIPKSDLSVLFFVPFN